MSVKRTRRLGPLQWKWWKRQIFLLHRWLGIVLCLFFAAWFVSGIFMMYVEYPQLDKQERLSGAQALNFSTAGINAAEAVAKLSAADYECNATLREILCSPSASPAVPIIAERVRLAMLLGRPVYYVKALGTARSRGVFADNGEILEIANSTLGERVSQNFYSRLHGNSISPQVHFLGMVQTDQWTLSSSLNAHRPLLHFALEDDKRTELYVSSTTAEVVRDSSKNERVLNYFAAVTHWLYPTVLRKFPNAWAWVVDIVASLGVLLSITGLWIGWLRWKRKPKPGKPAIPYKGIMRWHYITGVLFGVVTLTWVFSGLLSMNPGKYNPSRSPNSEQRQLFTGTEQPVLVDAFPLLSPRFPKTAVSAELVHFNGRALYRIVNRNGRQQQLDALTGEEFIADVDVLKRLARKLLPEEDIINIDLMKNYDNYYFSRHPERGGKPLPILRVIFGDDDNTWFHIDSTSGELLEKSTSVNRVYRWLYNGLHSWDILWLWERRPLWDIAVIGFSLGGFSLSLLGVVVGWRRLRQSV
jgi:hypothetical protein